MAGINVAALSSSYDYTPGDGDTLLLSNPPAGLTPVVNRLSRAGDGETSWIPEEDDDTLTSLPSARMYKSESELEEKMRRRKKQIKTMFRIEANAEKVHVKLRPIYISVIGASSSNPCIMHIIRDISINIYGSELPITWRKRTVPSECTHVSALRGVLLHEGSSRDHYPSAIRA